jgi:hypothetical protein
MSTGQGSRQRQLTRPHFFLSDEIPSRERSAASFPSSSPLVSISLHCRPRCGRNMCQKPALALRRPNQSGARGTIRDACCRREEATPTSSLVLHCSPPLSNQHPGLAILPQTLDAQRLCGIGCSVDPLARGSCSHAVSPGRRQATIANTPMLTQLAE